MRIHLQSKTSVIDFALGPDQWHGALARAGRRADEHDVSFGNERGALEAGLQGAEILVIQTSALRDGLPPAPRLRMVYVTSAGLEKFAPYDWLPPGALLLNNRGTHEAKAGEYGLMALLMLINHMPALYTAQREGRWDVRHGSLAAGKRLLVLGLGTLGGAAARHARSFGMAVTGVRTTATPHPDCDRVVATEALDSVLGEADYIYLAAPLTPATRHILDRRRIGLLPRGAGLANVGRGGLIEQDALLDALDDGHLGGAVIDVVEPEPLPPGHRIWGTRNLIVTPHVSADDPATYTDRSLDIFLENLLAFERGERPANVFDTERGY